jgi:DNA-binding CsgD family transcriptional regulator
MAHLRGRFAEALELTNDGRAASDAVADAAYLFPFLVTGTRVRLALGDVGDARRWVTGVSDRLRERSIPGTLPAIDHAHGLLALATGAAGEARRALSDAHLAWTKLGRTWEGTTSALELATAELRANRPAEAIRLATVARATAQSLPSPPVAQSADDVLRMARARHPADEPWAPLTAREWEVARLIAGGATNAEIAEQLAISPRTVGTHVEHILGKLGAARRSEVAAWATRMARTGGGNDVPAAHG